MSSITTIYQANPYFIAKLTSLQRWRRQPRLRRRRRPRGPLRRQRYAPPPRSSSSSERRCPPTRRRSPPQPHTRSMPSGATQALPRVTQGDGGARTDGARDRPKAPPRPSLAVCHFTAHERGGAAFQEGPREEGPELGPLSSDATRSGRSACRSTPRW